MIVLLSGYSSWSQNGSFAIEFTEKALTTDNTGIVEAYVKLRNLSTVPVEGIFDAHSSHEDLYITQRKSKTISLAANDSIFIPVKAIVSSTAAAGNQSNIEAVFTISGTDETKNAIVPVTIRERKQVRMLLMETDIIFEHMGDSLRIPVRVANEGNSAQKIAIVARYPNFLSIDGIENTVLNVQAFTDTTVILKKRVNRAVLKQEDFTISITALYLNGDIISSGTVHVSSIKQDRRYIPTGMGYEDYYNLQANQITGSYQRNSDNSTAYFLYANSEAKINEAVLQANLDLNWWESSEQFFLRNTWLSYTQGSFGASAGSISKFLDVNIIGRGVESNYTFGKNVISAGAVDKSFNLYDSNNISMGESGWLTFSHDRGGMAKGYNVNLIYNNDAFAENKSYLASAAASLIKKDYLNVNAEGAFSSSTSLLANETESGGAGELIATGVAGNFTYSSSNYYSSGFYAGLKRGVMNFNERLNFSFDKYVIWTLFNKLKVNPERFGVSYLSIDLESTRYEAGVTRRFKSFSISAAPGIYREIRTEQYAGDPLPVQYTLDAARVSLAVNFNHSKTRQNVSLLLDGGLFSTNTGINDDFHFKANFNYNWKMFNMLVFYQYNNFYLGELISNIKQGQTEKYYNFTVAPTTQLLFLNKKLKINAGLSYTKNTVINSIQFNGRMEYDITRDLGIFVYNFYNEMFYRNQNANTIQFGITKKFNPIRIDRTLSDFEVYVFYDASGKGALDPANMPAANQLVIIDGRAFRTNSDGIIKYRSVPPGNYEVRIVNNNNEWHAYSRTIAVNGDTKAAIGMTRTATIKGSVSYFGSEKSYQIARKKNGLSVIAVDDNGNVFTTKTDDNGNFVLYVPGGNYTVTLEKAGISEYIEMENNNQPVQAEPSKIKQVDFKLNIKEKRVETKKFSSRGFPSLPAPAKEDKKKK